MSHGFAKTARLSAAWDFSARIGSQWAMFAVSVFVARILTPEDYGIAAAARFFITLASRLTQLGLNASLVRMETIRDDHVSSVFLMNVAAGGLAYFVLSMSGEAVGRFFGSPAVGQAVPVFAAVFLIAPFSSVPAALLQRRLNYKASTLIGAADAVFGALASLALALAGWGYWSLILGSLAGTLLSTVSRIYITRWRPSLRMSLQALREVLSFGLGFQAKRLLYFATTNVDNLIIGRLLGMASLGIYDKGFGLMRQISDRMAFDGALMRIFAIIREDAPRLRRGLLKAVQATATLAFPILIVTAAAANHLIPALFGSQWIPSVTPFRILVFVGMIRMGTRAIYAANEALGAVWQQTAYQAVALAVLATGVAVGSRWGLEAASVGVLAAAAIDAWLNCRILERLTTVSISDLARALAPPAAIAAALGVSVIGVNVALGYLGATGDWTFLLVDALLVAVVYPASLLWGPFPSVRAIVQETIDEMAPSLRRWAPFSKPSL